MDSDPDYKTILVTGGLGYIGSHTCVALAQAGYRIAIVDNLANSKLAVLERIRGLAPEAKIDFHRADLRDRAALDKAFAAQPIAAVIHFAGLKAVGESVEKPLLYYDNNVGGSVALLEAMAKHGVKRLVFSSSATVYGEPERLPLTEDHPLRPASPYGKTKLVIEHVLADAAAADPAFAYAALRYFNPIGAHPSGRIGEDPRGVPNNLFPYLTQVAAGRLPRLRVFGADYPTPDGSGVRDYIHVTDLAAGHLAALAYLDRKKRSITANLGTGRGYSVLETVRAFEKTTGIEVPLEIA
ncbi:MAG: UDP-glucose 4-epimerase GalE, partial [Burkholderiales bacterium]